MPCTSGGHLETRSWPTAHIGRHVELIRLVGHAIKNAGLSAALRLKSGRRRLELWRSGDSRAFTIRSDAKEAEPPTLRRVARNLTGGMAVEVGPNIGASSRVNTFADFEMNAAPYSEVTTPLRGRSVEIAGDLSSTVDVLFVDGDHPRGGTFGDLEAWLPFAKREAWIAMHETGWAESVQAAIAEVIEPVRTGTTFELPNRYMAQIGPTP